MQRYVGLRCRLPPDKLAGPLAPCKYAAPAAMAPRLAGQQWYLICVVDWLVRPVLARVYAATVYADVYILTMDSSL